MKKPFFAVALSAALLVTTAACGGEEGGGDTDVASISVGTFPISINLLEFVGKDQGMFEDNGLDATVIPSMAGATALQLMSNNKLQSYAIDFLSTLQAAKQGAEIRLAGCIAPRSVYVIVAGEKSGLDPEASFEDRVKSLEGKTIGVTALGAGTDRALVALLGSQGISEDAVQRIAVGVPSAAAGHLGEDRIDAYITGAHSAAFQIEKTAPGSQFFLDLGEADAPETVRMFASGGWAVSKAWADSNPEQVDSYMEGLKDARDWVVENPDEAATVFSQQAFGGDHEDVAKRSIEVLVDDFYALSDPDFKCSQESFDAAATVFEEQGLGKASDLSFDDVVLERARP